MTIHDREELGLYEPATCETASDALMSLFRSQGGIDAKIVEACPECLVWNVCKLPLTLDAWFSTLWKQDNENVFGVESKMDQPESVSSSGLSKYLCQLVKSLDTLEKQSPLVGKYFVSHPSASIFVRILERTM